MRRVIAEPGMRLSVLTSLLETVGLHPYISLRMRRVIAEPGMRLSVLTSLLDSWPPSLHKFAHAQGYC